MASAEQKPQVEIGNGEQPADVEKKVVKLKSIDGEVFQVDYVVAIKSFFIKTMLDNLGRKCGGRDPNSRHFQSLYFFCSFL
jgi:hypothetical protein